MIQQAFEIPRLALSPKMTRSSTYDKYACGLVIFVSSLDGFFNSLLGYKKIPGSIRAKQFFNNLRL
ncbi:MAG: hypothetical protein WA118_05970 [Carboxydocellales bacterium]